MSVSRIGNIMDINQDERLDTAKAFENKLLAERRTMDYPRCQHCNRRVSAKSYSKRHGVNCSDNA